MLSWSVESIGGELDTSAITNRELDPLVPGGNELLGFVDAILSRSDVEQSRDAVVARLGEPAAVDAAAVTGNFEMMNRIADGVGMPVGGGTRQRMRQTIEELRLDRFPHA